MHRILSSVRTLLGDLNLFERVEPIELRAIRVRRALHAHRMTHLSLQYLERGVPYLRHAGHP